MPKACRRVEIASAAGYIIDSQGKRIIECDSDLNARSPRRHKATISMCFATQAIFIIMIIFIIVIMF
jgi:hypothetical protein